MAFSSVGKKKVAAHVALYFVNIIVLALAARVNLFQEFFCESSELKLLKNDLTLSFKTLPISSHLDCP